MIKVTTSFKGHSQEFVKETKNKEINNLQFAYK